MRFVAGRGAVATEMLAGAPWWKAIENQLLAEAPWRSITLDEGAGADKHREAAVRIGKQL